MDFEGNIVGDRSAQDVAAGDLRLVVQEVLGDAARDTGGDLLRFLHQLNAGRTILHGDAVARLDQVTGDIDAAAVDEDMTMRDQLTGGRTAGGVPRL